MRAGVVDDEEVALADLREGALDRGALGKRVFSDPEALALLNRISHRHIIDEVNRRLADYAMQGGTLAALDAVELIESGLAAECALTVGVLAPRETRLARIMRRDGISREAALRRIDAQKSDRYYIDNCGLVLQNDGDVGAFEKEFEEALKETQHG